MSNSAVLTPEQERRVFLTLLHRDATSSHVFHFRTFDDTPVKRRYLSQSTSNRLENCEQTLQDRNGKGAGVFVVINEGGQKDAEITKVRAVFADTDGAPLEPFLEAHFKPHCVIQSSPGKWHVYYLVTEDFPLGRFTSVQKAIAAKFGTDPQVSNLSRVMRVPGFCHCKDQRFKVHFVLEHLRLKLPRYTVDQIINGLALQAHLATQTRSSAVPAQQQAFCSGQDGTAEIEEMLRFISPWGDRDVWMKVVFAVADLLGPSGRGLVVRWSRGDLWHRANS